MEPDFEALAEAWVAGDPRLRELARTDPERARQIGARLAQALERRRREVGPPPPSGDLVINVDRSRFVPGAGLDAEALEQMARYIEEVARDEEEEES